MLICIAAWLCAIEPTRATAQAEAGDPPNTRPRAALLTTGTVRSGAEAERDQAVDSVVHAALDQLDVVDVVARPALDLQSMQLSLDCVGETSTCLQAVAGQLKTDVLIAPAIQRTGEELVLSILYFDARASELRRVTRRQPGNALEAATLDAVPEMLRELFQVEAAAPAQPGPDASAAEGAVGSEGADDSEWSAPEEPDESAGAPVGPLLLGGGGLLTLGAGIAVGLAMKNTEDEYAEFDVTNPAEAEAARDKLDDGHRQALIANVLIGVGATALIASAIWLAADLSDDGARDSGETALRPFLGPSHAGVLLTGTWQEAP